MADGTIFDNLRESLSTTRGNLAYPFIRSAVIVPLIHQHGSVQVVFELRSWHLRRSPGEVGFPGGRVENGETPWQAALRELEEELEVGNGQVECLGRLPEQQRRRDELIVPFVARLDEQANPKPDGVEVDEVFTVELDHLLENEFREAGITERYTLSDDFPRKYLSAGSWDRKVERTVRYLVVGNHLIWGLSANILVQLLQLLR